MIIIYGKPNCSYCEKAVKLCEDHKLKYKYKSVSDPDVGFELMELKNDVKTFPQIWWYEKYIGGYNDLIVEIENLELGNYGQGAF
jgi:glutaredoxin 1